MIRLLVPTLGRADPRVRSYAECATAGEDHFAPKPTMLTFEQASAVPISGWVPARGCATMASGGF
jgi:NADPH:quinone reductase-like Zn-dependent oxidoreductase